MSDYAQDSSERSYSPIILTSTRFRRRPSNSRASHSAWPQKIRSQVPKASASPRLMCAERARSNAQSSRPGGRWLQPRPRLRLAAHAASGARRRCPFARLRTCLTGAVVQPAQRPASSLMNTLAVMCGSTLHCMAFTRTSALLETYHTHTPDGRGHCCIRSRPEQPQLNPASTAENESCYASARRDCTVEASRQQDTFDGSS